MHELLRGHANKIENYYSDDGSDSVYGVDAAEITGGNSLIDEFFQTVVQGLAVLLHDLTGGGRKRATRAAHEFTLDQSRIDRRAGDIVKVRCAARVRALSPAASKVMEKHGKPLYNRLEKLINEGIASGDFRRVDPIHTVTSIIGLIVFYFISMPAQQFMHAGDPGSPERIAQRRAAVLDFICAAIFNPAAAQDACKP